MPRQTAKDVIAKANRLSREGKKSRAIAVLETALRDRPDHPAIVRALAKAYRRNGQQIESLTSYDRLIELGHADAEVWHAIGEGLVGLREFAQAIGAFRNGLEFEDRPTTRHELGRALFQLGRVDEAITELEKVIESTNATASHLALATMIPGAPSASQAKIRAVRERFAEVLRRESVRDIPLRERPQREKTDKLRIGYISSFFHRSNYMKPVWALINHHNRERFHITLFSDSAADARMEGYEPNENDRVINVHGQSCRQIASRIRGRELDVLVDLNAYSETQLLPLWLAPLAPVTVAWFNMYATSGLPGIDWIVGDTDVLAIGDDAYYSEQTYRLPVSYLTFDVGHAAPPVAECPAVKNGFMTFGSLVAQYKVTESVIDAWSEILSAVPGSRLVLANRCMASSCNRDAVIEEFAKRGVAAERIELRGPAPHYEYLGNYDSIDIALDAFPYNGGTTTMEAMWQGVPVLTFNGDRWASRTSQTLLNAAGLKDFVANSQDDYIARGIRLGTDPSARAELKILRRSLRDAIQESPVMAAGDLTNAMEDFYERAAGESRGRSVS